MFKKLTFCLAVSACFSLTPCLATSPQLQAAIDDYNAHRYNLALIKLNKLEQGFTKNSKEHAQVHYYTALCDQSLNQIGAAKENYLWVYDNATDPTLHNDALSALASINNWSMAREYSGNGNNFVRSAPGPGSTRRFSYNASNVTTSMLTKGSGST